MLVNTIVNDQTLTVIGAESKVANALNGIMEHQKDLPSGDKHEALAAAIELDDDLEGSSIEPIPQKINGSLEIEESNFDDIESIYTEVQKERGPM